MHQASAFSGSMSGSCQLAPRRLVVGPQFLVSGGAERQVFTLAASSKSPSTSSTSPSLFGGATNIRGIGLQDAEKIYVSLSERTNSKHILMVLHAPWCSHCGAMEPEVRRLAQGLKGESNQLSIVSLDCDAPAARYFAKHVLGVPSLPAFCVFPKKSRTFYKYKGETRTAESLLKFVNMVCNQNESRLWEIPPKEEQELGKLQGGSPQRGTEGGTPPAQATTAPAPPPVVKSASPVPPASTASKQLPPKQTLSIMSRPTTPLDEAALASLGIPAGILPQVTVAARVIVGVALLAGTILIIKSRQQQDEGEMDMDKGEGSPSSSSLSSSSGGAPPVSREQQQQPFQRLLEDIDSALGRLAGVMLRLVRARIGLAIAPLDDSDLQPQGRGRLAGPPAALGPTTSALAAAPSLPPPSPSSPSASSLLAPSPVPVKAAPPLPSSPAVSAETVLKMLEQDDGDVGKVIDRLMQEQKPKGA